MNDHLIAAIREIGITKVAILMGMDPRSVYNWINRKPRHRRSFIQNGLFKTPVLAYAALLDAARNNADGLRLLCDLEYVLPSAREVTTLLPRYATFEHEAFGATLRSLGTQAQVAQILDMHMRSIQYWYRLSRDERYPPFMRGLLHTPSLAYATLIDSTYNNLDGLDTLNASSLPGASRIALLLLDIAQEVAT